MSYSLEELGISTDEVLEPTTDVVCIMRSGERVRISTPLSPEDVMTLWNTRKGTMKIPAGDRSYVVIKKKHVDYLHTFIQEDIRR